MICSCTTVRALKTYGQNSSTKTCLYASYMPSLSKLFQVNIEVNNLPMMREPVFWLQTPHLLLSNTRTLQNCCFNQNMTIRVNLSLLHFISVQISVSCGHSKIIVKVYECLHRHHHHHNHLVLTWSNILLVSHLLYFRMSILTNYWFAVVVLVCTLLSVGLV